MGRTVIAEENTQIKLESFRDDLALGVLVGQQTHQQKDYIVHIVETPKESDDWDGTLDTISDSWVSNHAKQVQCMIPGGLKVVGVFVVGTPQQLNSSQVKMRQIAFSVQKALNKLDIVSEDPETKITEKILVQMCSLSKKLTCRTFDCSDPKCGAKPADWKCQKFLDAWIRLTSFVTVDFYIPVTVEMGNKSFRKQIQTGILPVCENIMNSIATLNKKLCNELDPLDTTKSGVKRKNKKDHLESSTFEVDLFSQSCSREKFENVKITQCCAKMYVRGTMCSRAFVHNKSLVKDAIKAIKSDVIMTIARRCELLCEELIDEEEQDPRILYETPRRVFVKLPDTSIEVCDYLFLDETENEIRERMQEVLGISVPPNSVEYCEIVPEDADLVKEDSISLPNNSDQTQTKPKSYVKKYIGVLLGGAMAAIAAGVSYLFIGEKEQF